MRHAYKEKKLCKTNIFSQGYLTNHTVASLLALPVAVYFEDMRHQTSRCNEITAIECGFNSINECIGIPWVKPFEPKNVIQSIINDVDVVKNNRIKITEENPLRKDNISVHTLSVRMPWYNDDDKIVGLFGCSIVLGKHSLAASLEHIVSLGLFNPIDTHAYLLKNSVGCEINNVYLSKREIECLNLVVSGKPSKEIGKILNISHRTVEHHIESMRIKLKCKNKVELIYKAFQQALLTH